MLEAKDVCFSYRDGEKSKQVLRNVNMNFEKGIYYAILGRSGSGKTTLMALLSALDSPQSGSIALDGVDIKKKGLNRYRRNSIGIVFQQFHLIPYMSAMQNILVATSISDNKAMNKAEIYTLLNSLGITEDKMHRPITQLSGGEQQRVGIARSLATKVDIIIADEPTGNLDKTTQKDIIACFQRMAHEEGKCVIVVTHSRDVANSSDVILKMDEGSLTSVDKR
ncbi:ABC transporter ATP-binding protein [Erysipelothrix sp. HDW6C]|uniref:ABC transporter ATP-binding protein n=1 Tax=Erysipelothrix sp. HDW6C TaxID=2714930 RepID=UPI00140BE302|nr:ABC transporter ATP-binding protein [Erysipelothrix sp. HDW6C]QIK69375.1 ABC transporter ATP-binding protein [Erysipelothrix sp. HDW6C]